MLASAPLLPTPVLPVWLPPAPPTIPAPTVPPPTVPPLGLGGPGDQALVRPLPQAQNRMSQMRNLIQTLVSGIAPAARSRATPQALLLDALCLLLDILAPKLRPVSAVPRVGDSPPAVLPSHVSTQLYSLLSPRLLPPAPR